MAKGAKTQGVKDIYEKRIEAFKSVRRIEVALAEFFSRYEKSPSSLATLVDVGVLKEIPQDPYGGEFYLDQTGKVRTTSDFAMQTEGAEVSSEALEMDDEPTRNKDKP
jgi:hypothetical protein